MGYTNPSGCVMIFFLCQSVIFWQFSEKTWQWLEFLETIFGFLYLSLKLSFSLPHKGKMLWCSHFRSFIKSAIFSKMGNSITKLNFISTPLKIIIPLENSVGGLYKGYRKPSGWVMIFLFTPKSFFDNFVKKIDISWSFHYLSLKLSLTFHHKGKMLSCSYFSSFIRSINLDRCGNFIENFNFVSTPWKIIIPQAQNPPTQHTIIPPYHPPSPPPPIPPPTSTPPTSYFFKSFIKLTNFSLCENVIKKLNFENYNSPRE